MSSTAENTNASSVEIKSGQYSLISLSPEEVNKYGEKIAGLVSSNQQDEDPDLYAFLEDPETHIGIIKKLRPLSTPNILLDLALNHTDPLTKALCLKQLSEHSPLESLDVAQLTYPSTRLMHLKVLKREAFLGIYEQIWDSIYEMAVLKDQPSKDELILAQQAVTALGIYFPEIIYQFGNAENPSPFELLSDEEEGPQKGRLNLLFEQAEKINRSTLKELGEARPQSYTREQRKLFHGLADMTSRLLAIDCEASGCGVYHNTYYGIPRAKQGADCQKGFPELTPFAKRVHRLSHQYLTGRDGLLPTQFMFCPEILPELEFHPGFLPEIERDDQFGYVNLDTRRAQRGLFAREILPSFFNLQELQGRLGTENDDTFFRRQINSLLKSINKIKAFNLFGIDSEGVELTGNMTKYLETLGNWTLFLKAHQSLVNSIAERNT